MTGDPRSNTARFRRHFAALHHFFVNKTANDHDAEDLAQQTLLACLEAMRRYRGDASFRTFLFAIARNTLLKHLRDRRIHVDLETQSRTLTDLGLGFTTLMDVRREQELLLRGLLCLSIDSQLILERYYWERMSARQIAARLEVSEAAVRGRLRKAKL
ncbi:MAG: sigma-70 family RNA polymerase sigma factor, partial [Myxococcota bacterium]